jgi:ubiquinone/menaquinone biosynthesis C-methylase UbiE
METTAFNAIDWGAYARCYDALLELSPYRAMLTDVTAALRLGGSDRILDAGCGTGNLLLRLQDDARALGVRPGAYFACDASNAMLARAKEKTEDVSFVRCDLDDRLPYDDESFDAIACVNALYATKDPHATIKEFHRTLTHGGRLVIVSPKRGYENGLILKAHAKSQKPDDYWRDAHRSVERERMLVSEACEDPEVSSKVMLLADYNRRIARDATFHFFEPSDLCALLRETGFRIDTDGLTYAGQNILVSATRLPKGASHV